MLVSYVDNLFFFSSEKGNAIWLCEVFLRKMEAWGLQAKEGREDQSKACLRLSSKGLLEAINHRLD